MTIETLQIGIGKIERINHQAADSLRFSELSQLAGQSRAVSDAGQNWNTPFGGPHGRANDFPIFLQAESIEFTDTASADDHVHTRTAHPINDQRQSIRIQLMIIGKRGDGKREHPFKSGF